jgi:cytochrome c oxidase subunit IV
MAEHTQTVNAIDYAQADPHKVHEHQVHGGPKVYGLVLAALLILTAITVAASRISFGSNMTNVIIAMGIASIKGSLVALFFMHLRWDKPMNAIIFCSSLFFLGLFLVTCYTDVIARPPVEPTNLKAPQPTPGAGIQMPAGGLAPAPGHGVPGAMSPTGGGKAIPGASPEGSYGGAAAGTNRPTPAPHK